MSFLPLLLSLLASTHSPVGADRSNTITLPEVTITAFDCSSYVARMSAQYEGVNAEEELAECRASEVTVHATLKAAGYQAAEKCGAEVAWSARDVLSAGEVRYLAFCHVYEHDESNPNPNY